MSVQNGQVAIADKRVTGYQGSDVRTDYGTNPNDLALMSSSYANGVLTAVFRRSLNTAPKLSANGCAKWQVIKIRFVWCCF